MHVFVHTDLDGPHNACKIDTRDRWRTRHLLIPIRDKGSCILECSQELPQRFHHRIRWACPLKQRLAQHCISAQRNAHFRRVPGKLDLLFFPQPSVVCERSALLALGELIANTRRIQCLQVVDSSLHMTPEMVGRQC